ncbi:LCP family protein [Frigoribacterium faeni]|uniref:LCP family protein n=1 Tax=Frigoribacterium faeni TaxID=145483 RepID=UPI001FACDBEF|nr:LCP family protein [Frigoribacterium faeni]MCJ0700464.1 LCP family protein [Frigoribacterium faeni]
MTDIFDFGPDEKTQQDDHRGRPRKKKRLSRPVKTLIVVASILVGILVVLGVVVGLYAMNLARTFDDGKTTLPEAFPAESTRPTASATGAMNILLMGSDSRGDETNLEDASSSDQRTDTMMLMHIDADRKNVYVMSIMRDLWVPIPGNGENKINAAFAYGGSPLTVQTIEQLTGARIDHVAIIDFEGFSGMTTSIGGVDVVSDKAFTARGTQIQVGTNHLEGEDALNFVRERYSFTDGDYTRVENQQRFVQAIADKLISRDTLTDPAAITNFVGSVSDYLTVDDTLDAGAIASLGVSLRDVKNDNIKFFTIPTSGTGMIGGQSVVLQAEGQMPGLRDALANDTLDAYLPTLQG